MAISKYYLSFDCATKSFAFSLLEINDLETYMPSTIACKTIEDLSSLVEELDKKTTGMFNLIGCGAVDLFPGKSNNNISTVERVRALQNYLRTEVSTALTGIQIQELNVLIEYQMGQNAPARIIMTTLVAEYSEANVIIVGPAMKNKVRIESRTDLYHSAYLEKYTSTYAANKEHTRDLYFNCIAPLFNHKLHKKIPRRFHKDFADSVIQVLGFRKFGDGSSNF